MPTIKDLMNDPEFVRKAMEGVVKAAEKESSDGAIVDARPAPYQYTEDVDVVENAIVQKIGGEERYRYPQVAPEMDIKDMNPDLYREQRNDALAGVKEARKTRDALHRKIEAVAKIQEPEHLKNLVTGSDEIIVSEALDAIADQYICADCKESKTTKKALNMHQMRMAHGEYAKDMPKYEKSWEFRHQQKQDEKNAGTSDDSGVDNGGSE